MHAPQRRKEWQEFKEWCTDRRLKAFPAHPWTVAAYILWLDANRRYRTLHKRLDVIARVHIRACVHSPENEKLVKDTLCAIEKRRQAGTHKSFTGKELLEPKKRAVLQKEHTSAYPRTLKNMPPLVSKRPGQELEY